MAPITRSTALLLSALILPACVTLGGAENQLTTYYNCGEMPLSATQAGSDAVDLNINGRIVNAKRVISASGVRYENNDPAQKVLFWSKGEEAMLDIGNKTYPACQMVKNSLYIDTSNYHAIGNDPAWFARINGNELVLTTHYGDKNMTSPLPAPQMTLHGQLYSLKTEGHVLSMTIRNKSCQDSVNNQYYPNEVSIIFDGEVFKGCGKSLNANAALTTGVVAPARVPLDPKVAIARKTWVAKSINGREALMGARVAIVFEEDGNMAGQAGCNDFSSHYEIGANSLKIGPKLIATQKVCPGRVQQQEKAFINLLLKSASWEVKDGKLTLRSANKKAVVFEEEKLI